MGRVNSLPLPAPSFDVVVGVDQTGAAVDGGAAARPLAVAVAVRTGERAWSIKAKARGAALKLPSLTPAEVTALLHSVRVKGLPEHTALLLDCVLGLPGDTTPRPGADALWAVMASSGQGDVDGVRFGMARAQRFFDGLLHAGGLPRRACEVACDATSVFQTRPFQKNVQTGTYRIWRDLTSSPARWLNLWPLETAPLPEAPWAFEAYPTWMWRTVFGVRTRDRSMLRLAVKMAGKRRGVTLTVDGWDVVEADADVADAVVLAAGGVVLQHEGRLVAPFAGFAHHPCREREGWIAGVIPLDGPASPKVASHDGGE